MAFAIFKPFSNFFFIKMTDVTFIPRTRRRLEKEEMIKWYTIFRLPVPNAGSKVHRNFGIQFPEKCCTIPIIPEF